MLCTFWLWLLIDYLLYFYIPIFYFRFYGDLVVSFVSVILSCSPRFLLFSVLLTTIPQVLTAIGEEKLCMKSFTYVSMKTTKPKKPTQLYICRCTVGQNLSWTRHFIFVHVWFHDFFLIKKSSWNSACTNFFLKNWIHISKRFCLKVLMKNLIIHSLKAQYCVNFYTTVILSVFALTFFLSLKKHPIH